MVRQPHLYVPRPWDSPELALGDGLRHHIERVLRRSDGANVTYTDGVGTRGTGLYRDGVVERGNEHTADGPSGVHVVVAPPHRSERLRTLVEKLAELGVESISWLDSQHRQSKDPKIEKCSAWMAAALEQSGGAWLPSIGQSLTPHDLTDLEGVLVALPDASQRLDPQLTPPVTLVVGPEGGFAPGEIDAGVARFTLGATTLRTETAAIAAASLALDRVAG